MSAGRLAVATSGMAGPGGRGMSKSGRFPWPIGVDGGRLPPSWSTLVQEAPAPRGRKPELGSWGSLQVSGGGRGVGMVGDGDGTPGGPAGTVAEGGSCPGGLQIGAYRSAPCHRQLHTRSTWCCRRPAACSGARTGVPVKRFNSSGPDPVPVVEGASSPAP
jgi:hypothetical protein